MAVVAEHWNAAIRETFPHASVAVVWTSKVGGVSQAFVKSFLP